MTHSLYSNMQSPALLAANITAAATSITLQSGGAAMLPAITGGNYIYATLFHSNQQVGGPSEIVKITNVVGSVLTVVRAQQGTSAYAYYMNDKLEIRVTAGGLQELAITSELDATYATDADVTAVAGTVTAEAIARAAADAAIIDGQIFTGPITYLGAGAVASNAGFGSGVLAANTTGASNTAVGTSALAANTTGAGNTAVGSSALAASTIATDCTAVGKSALAANTTGVSNTAVGSSALYLNTTGASNTAVGTSALAANTTGAGNTAVGSSALAASTIATDCTAVGKSALAANTTGIRNTAVGSSALYLNTTGGYNIAVGVAALASNTTGGDNIAVGFSALYSNITGTSNIAVGSSALYLNSNGINNTAVGFQALSNEFSGSNNVAVGYLSGTDAVVNITTQSNKIVLGNNSHDTAYIKVAWTVTSDRRDKVASVTSTESELQLGHKAPLAGGEQTVGEPVFAPVPHGLSFVNQLMPVVYQYKVSREDETPSGPTRYGFLAQDILALEGETPVIINAEDPDNLKYTEASLIPVLVNAIQDLSKAVEQINVRLAMAGL